MDEVDNVLVTPTENAVVTVIRYGTTVEELPQ